MGKRTLYVIIVLIGSLGLLTGGWLISRLESHPAQTTQARYTAYSGIAPAPVTPTRPPTFTPSPTPRPPTPPPSSGGSPGDPSGTTSTEQQIAQAVFQAINTSRAAAGLPALQWSAALAGGAHRHNLVMVTANQLSHRLPGEPDLGTRITQDGVRWTACGENIGLTPNISTNGALGLHNLMMAEQPPNDGHRRNILSANFTMVGIDILIDSRHQLWLTEDFAAS